jgi:hypothetical protein
MGHQGFLFSSGFGVDLLKHKNTVDYTATREAGRASAVPSVLKKVK